MACEGPAAVDDLSLLLQHRPQQCGKLLGSIFQIRIADDDVVASGQVRGSTDGGAFPSVHRMAVAHQTAVIQ